MHWGTIHCIPVSVLFLVLLCHGHHDVPEFPESGTRAGRFAVTVPFEQSGEGEMVLCQKCFAERFRTAVSSSPKVVTSQTSMKFGTTINLLILWLWLAIRAAKDHNAAGSLPIFSLGVGQDIRLDGIICVPDDYATESILLRK
jgi:hypothetical protein